MALRLPSLKTTTTTMMMIIIIVIITTTLFVVYLCRNCFRYVDKNMMTVNCKCNINNQKHAKFAI